jgi:predicted ferric reductase
MVVASLWVGDRLWRFGRLVYFNYSKGKFTDATVVALPGEATRVTLHLPRYVEIKPGTHAYLRFALLNAWESHPFSIAWVEHNSVYVPKSEKLAEDNKQILDKEKSTTDVSFVIHAHTGLTKRLYDRAAAMGPSRNLTIRAAFEGPYGGHHSLDSYGHAVLFAGSSGISHQIPYVRRLIEGYGDETVATRRVTLVWIIREPEHLEWVRPWMDAILRMPNRRSILHVKVYITRPKSPRAIHSASEKVQMFAGRPNIPLLLEQEVSQQVGAMAVTVCGPGGLADNIRDAVRKVQDQGVIDFVEESFTW